MISIVDNSQMQESDLLFGCWDGIGNE